MYWAIPCPVGAYSPGCAGSSDRVRLHEVEASRVAMWVEEQGGQVRWLLPLVLSAFLHLLLLQMLVAARAALPLRVSGSSSRMTVILTKPAPQSLPAPAPGAPAPATQLPRPLAQTAPPAPARVQEQTMALIRLGPGTTKKVLLPRVERIAQPQPATPPAKVAANLPGPPRSGGATAATAPGSAAPAPPAAAVQPAAPMAAGNRPPEYPALARKRGWEGKVLLAVAVASDGVVQEVRVQQGCGHKLLDEAARAAVREWRFQPGSRAGEPVAMQVLVPVHFMLREKS